MTGRIAGATREARAAALAGALAEAGVTTLKIDGDAVHARETDLPGCLLASGACTIRDPSGAFEARFDADSCLWRASDPELGARLADISDS